VVAPLFQRNVPPGILTVAVKVAAFPLQIEVLLTLKIATGLTVSVLEMLFAAHPTDDI
jgi:hypothetical protein